MAAKTTRIAGIDKTIFIDEKFVSAPKSLISTAIFNVKGRTETLNITKENYMGYKFFKLLGTSLNLGIDFQFFFAIVLKYHETKSNVVELNTNDIYKRIDPKNTQAQNNNGAFIKRLKDSAIRIMDLKMEVSNDNESFLLSTLFPTISVKADKSVYVVVNPLILDIFKIDSNALYNINFEIYNELDLDYSKALYLYHLSNNANIINKFSVEDLRDRLLCQDVEDKKFNFNVSKAHDELKDVGFLKYAEKVTTRKKKVTHYEVSTKVKSKEEADELKKEIKEVKEKKVEVKKVKEPKLVEPKEIKVEQVKPAKPDVKKSLAAIEFEKTLLQSKLFKQQLGEF